MNNLEVFNNAEFGQMRTVSIKGKIYFVGNDIAKALEYARPYEAVSAHCKGAVSYRVLTKGGEQDAKVIPEGDVYRLIVKASDQSKNPNIKEKAERFESWVFDEVLPSIRETGEYQNRPLTQLEILQQSVEILNRHEAEIKQIDTRMDKLEYEIPLYGAEADEMSAHIRRRGVNLLGGKESEAYNDRKLRDSLYRNMYSRLKEEFGVTDDEGRPRSYKAMKRKYIADAHEFIDCYTPPFVLQEQIDGANAQMRIAG